MKHPVLSSTVALCFSLLTTPVAAADLGLGYGFYAAANLVNEQSGKGKEVNGNSLELGASVMMAHLHASVFGKQVRYGRLKTGDDGKKTSYAFRDNLYGVGGRFVGKGFSFKLGRAFHNVTASESTDGVDTANASLPSGRDSGLFFGGGLWIGGGNDLAIFVDFTRYQLQASNYKIDEISIGAALPLIGSSSGGGKGSK